MAINAKRIAMWKSCGLSTKDAVEFEISRVENGKTLSQAHQELKERFQAEMRESMARDISAINRCFGFTAEQTVRDIKKILG